MNVNITNVLPKVSNLTNSYIKIVGPVNVKFDKLFVNHFGNHEERFAPIFVGTSDK